jgi:hypothetical protein
MKVWSLNKTRPKSGFVLPTLMLVTMVLLILVTTLLAAGTNSLRVATSNQQSDQALYAAEAGLVRASQVFAADGSIAEPFEGDLGSSASSYSVMAYENTGSVEMQVPNGPMIPPSTVYLRSEGISENGTRRVEGALFTIGLQAFKVGALGNQVHATNSSFDAYNSASGDYDPTNVQNDLPLLASNSNSGPTFTFDNAEVNGDIFVGPGGDPAAQVSNTNSTVGDVTAMASAIDLEEIEVPEDPDGGGDPASVPALGSFSLTTVDASGIYHFSDGHGLDIDIDPSIPPTPSNPYAHITAPPGAEWQYSIEANGETSLTIKLANGHQLWVSEMTQQGSHIHNGQASHSGVAETNVDLSTIVFHPDLFDGGTAPPPATVVNPTVLEPGHYESVTIEDGWNADFSESGVYVIKHLNVTSNGQLTLPGNAQNATLYVTQSLTVDGENALVNETLKASKMKVFYTGTSAVQLSGGSRSYFTLVAPEADVTLDSVIDGARTRFFGALVGDNVTINNASFHFDTATNGIGTGTMGSAVTLLHRHRL